MDKLVAVNHPDDIFELYRNSPLQKMLEYHNLGFEFDSYTNAELIAATCMDNRVKLKLPENFAYILRTGGANTQNNQFHISYAIAVGKVNHFALIGHNDCGMVSLDNRKERFIEGLRNIAGWNRKSAVEHFGQSAPDFEIEDEIEFVLREVIRLRKTYPQITVAPFMYLVEDNRIYQVREE